MKSISLLSILIISSLLNINSAFAYNGCREIYREYDTKLWEEFNMDIGNGNTMYLVLRCTSDCFNLSMGGDRNGSATLCGTRKAEGSWAYQACGEGTDSAPYGTTTIGVANLMLSQCSNKESRRIDRENARIERDNEKARKDNVRIFLNKIDASNSLKDKSQLMLDTVDAIIDSGIPDEKNNCLKQNISSFTEAIKKVDISIVEFKRGIKSTIKRQYEIGQKGENYYTSANKIHNNAIEKVQSCIDEDKSSSSTLKTEKITPDVSSRNDKNVQGDDNLYTIEAKPHLNIRKSPSTTAEIVATIKNGLPVRVINLASKSITLSGKKGKWVQIQFDSSDNTGYVFDAYLKKIKYLNTISDNDNNWQILDHYKVKEGLAKDLNTGLMWMRCSIGQKWKESSCLGKVSEMTWGEAMKITKYFKYAGYSDWRMPTRAELLSLRTCSSGKVEIEEGDDGKKVCKVGYEKPAIQQTVFNAIGKEGFWSSSPYAYGDNVAWGINFDSGYHGTYLKYLSLQVRLVRKGQ